MILREALRCELLEACAAAAWSVPAASIATLGVFQEQVRVGEIEADLGGAALVRSLARSGALGIWARAFEERCEEARGPSVRAARLALLALGRRGVVREYTGALAVASLGSDAECLDVVVAVARRARALRRALPVGEGDPRG